MAQKVRIVLPARRSDATQASHRGDGCPSRQQLKQSGTIKKLVADWRVSFDANEESYRQSLYQALADRYLLAWAIWEDQEVQRHWIKEHGALLAMRPSEQSDEHILRSVVVATISDKENASKVFKRLSGAWIGEVKPSSIFEWLRKNKLEKRSVPPKTIPLKQFDKTPLVLRGVGDVVKAEANSKIVIEGTIMKRSGDDIEIKSVVVRTR